jgi:uncharacterized protein (DUF2147 family)
MKLLVKIAVFTCILLHHVFAQMPASDAIVGTWMVQDGTAKVKIEKSNGKFSGKIVWLKQPSDKGKPVCDTKNPDKSLQNRPLAGMKLLDNFMFDNEHTWIEGTIYDPDSGKTYSCKITMKNNKEMEVRGYVGISLFGRTETWNRTQETAMN